MDELPQEPRAAARWRWARRETMASVFISSTGKDLMDYRQAAIDVCIRLELRRH